MFKAGFTYILRKSLMNTRTKNERATSVVLLFFCRRMEGLEPALGEAEHNRVFARHLRMMGRAHQVLSPHQKGNRL